MVRKKDDKFWKFQTFEHKPAPNYSMAKIFYIRKQNLNSKNDFWWFFNFLFKGGKLLNFGKKQIFKRNSTRNYFCATKFHTKRPDFNTDKTTFGDIGILHCKGKEGEKSLSFEIFRFSKVTRLQFTAVWRGQFLF